jgi:hypothetical protein
MGKEGKTCFVIGPIGEPKSEIRAWSDKILDYVIGPAVKKCGYEKPIRADQISKSGMITFEVVQHLIFDDLVIADLTGRNANVYYELGIRHSVRKSFVQVIREGDEMPFDTKDLRTIKIGTDVEVATKASLDLEAYIPEIERLKGNINTPVSIVAEIEVLRTSGRSQEQAIGELLAKMEGLREGIKSLSMKLDNLPMQLQTGIQPTLADLLRKSQTNPWDTTQSIFGSTINPQSISPLGQVLEHLEPSDLRQILEKKEAIQRRINRRKAIQLRNKQET